MPSLTASRLATKEPGAQAGGARRINLGFHPPNGSLDAIKSQLEGIQTLSTPPFLASQLQFSDN